MRNELTREFSGMVRQVFSVAVKAVVASLLFATSVVMILRSMGVPMPSPYELLREFGGLSKLAKIVS